MQIHKPHPRRLPRQNPNACASVLTACLVAMPALLAAPAVWAQAGDAAAVPLQVEGFNVQGNTLLPAADIDARLADFKGPSTLARLREAASAVQDLYRRAGYGGVVAFLPEHTPTGGVVRIRVVEGKLERVDIADNVQFSADNIRASLPALEVGATPRVRRIDTQIQMANENPAKVVQVLLQPGAVAGGVAAKVSVAEQPVQRWTARLDNTGSERTGRLRAALGWQHANVAGRDHVFNAEVQLAPEELKSVAVVSAGYRVPFYAQSMALDVYGAWSDVDAGKSGTAAGDLEFAGRGHVLGLRGSAYLSRLGNVDQRLALALEARDYLNDCAIAGLPAGACGSAGESVSVQPLSLAYTAQSGGENRLGLSLSLHHNLALGGRNGSAADFAAVRPGTVRRYTVLRASAQGTLPLDGGAAVVAHLSAQAADKPLVPGELFGIGGQYSVRGYEERELGGDRGVQLGVEYLSADFGAAWSALPKGDWRWLLFAGAGRVSNRQGDPCLPGRTECTLGAVGAGLRMSLPGWQLRLDLARALDNGATTARGDTRAHLSLTASF